MSRSPVAALVAVLALVAAACTGASGASSASGTGAPSAGPSASVSGEPMNGTTRRLEREVCAQNSHEVLLRTWRGVMLGRSGDIQIIAKYPSFVHGGLTHSTPYDYTQEVPLFLYGPGYVKPGVYDAPMTLADVAPTAGQILKFDFPAPDGRAHTEGLLPADQRPLPRLLVTLIWDAAGTYVLNRWKRDWPYLRSLLPHGAWFTNVTLGSSPSNTPTGHSVIGTGAFPMHNGMVDEYIRVNGRIEKPNENGPAFMVDPTLADLYDRAMGNRPIVGAVATLAAHIMMMGHGSEWGGGDKDIAITREKEFAATAGAESTTWNLTPDMAPFYTLPSHVNQLPPLSTYVDALDRADGVRDGKWRSDSIAQLSNGFDTPARTPFQTTLLESLIQHEGFGTDDVPDLLYVNYKAIDTISHLFSADSVEMSDAVKYQDDALRELVGFLNRTVGKGKWVLALLSDHGSQRDPAVSGAFLIDIDRLTQDIAQRFDGDGDGVPLIEKVRPTEIWLNQAELKDNGYTPAQVSQYIMGLTQADTIKAGTTPTPGQANDTVFSAALPSSILSRLPCLPEARGS